MSGEIGAVVTFDPAEIRQVREETAVEHFLGLISNRHLTETPEAEENCRAAAAEDIVLLLDCPDNYAEAMVRYLECEMIWENENG